MALAARHPSIQTLPTAGCVVEFMQGNEPQLAWVEEASGDKLRLYTSNKREAKLAANRLLPWIGPRFEGAFTREAILEKLKHHGALREELARCVDALEIWELAQGEVSQNSTAWFAQLAFDDPDVDRLAATGRSLLARKTHFKFQPPNFEVYPAETVERRLAEQAAARERELVVNAGHGFFQELWGGWSSGRRKDLAKLAAGLDPDAADRLKGLLLGLMADPDSQELAPLWQSLRKGLPEHPCQPLILAMEWGIVPAHYNALLDEIGYASGDGWSARYAGEIEALAADCTARRETPVPAALVSVDAPTTRDIDDAFHVETLEGGGWKVVMALARPTLSWDFSSPLGRAVSHRASSLYLPEGSSHMLPEALGLGLYSLVCGQDRPALLLNWELDAAGQTVSFAPGLGWVRVAANLSYEAVQAVLAAAEGGGVAGEGVGAQHAACLRAACGLAGVLRRERIARGAVVIDRPDPKITLTGYPDQTRVDIGASQEHPLAQMAVSELMILANSAMAAWGAAQSVPLLHRVQDISVPPGCAGVWTDPVGMHQVVRQLSPASLEVRAARHASLAAPAYAPVTSPLRRISDMVNAAQVEAFLSGAGPRFSREQLLELLPALTARLDAVGQVQRFRPRYWKLVYMQRHCREEEFEAVVLEDCGPFLNVGIGKLQIMARVGRSMLGEAKPGQRLLVQLGKVDPLTNEFRVLAAREAEERPDVADWFNTAQQGET